MPRTQSARFDTTDYERNTQSRTDRSLPSSETLELVADETRRAIIRALWNAEEPLQFSTLRRRAGIEESGRFNYHLKRLRRNCVRDTDDGYSLTPTGERFVGALYELPAVDEPAECGVCAND